MTPVLSNSKHIPVAQKNNTDALPSALASNLIDNINTEERLIVLDMGRAVSSTIKYFSQYKCRLNFIDLYSEDFVLDPDEEMSHSKMVDLMCGAIKLQQSVKIDICLFWDIFSYLSDPLVRALIESLEEHIDSSTRSLIINPRDSRTMLPFYYYGISGPTLLTQSHRVGVQPCIYPRSQRALKDLIDYFVVDRGRLMSEGRAEYLLFKDNNITSVNNSIASR
jgi:hypothetical protein